MEVLMKHYTLKLSRACPETWCSVLYSTNMQSPTHLIMTTMHLTHEYTPDLSASSFCFHCAVSIFQVMQQQRVSATEPNAYIRSINV